MSEIGSGTASERDHAATERGSGGGTETESGTRRGGGTAGDPMRQCPWGCKRFWSLFWLILVWVLLREHVGFYVNIKKMNKN